jgi:hypothetical protein
MRKSVLHGKGEVCTLNALLVVEKADGRFGEGGLGVGVIIVFLSLTQGF